MPERIVVVPGSGSALPDDIRESVAISGVDSVAGAVSSLANLSYANAIGNVNLSQQNAAAFQQALNQLNAATLGNAVNLVGDLQPMEAAAVVKMDTGNDLAEQISDLKASLSNLGGGGTSPGGGKIVQRNGKTIVTLSLKLLPAVIQIIDNPKKVLEIVEPGTLGATVQSPPLTGNLKAPSLVRQNGISYIILSSATLPAIIKFTDSVRIFEISVNGTVIQRNRGDHDGGGGGVPMAL